MPEPLRIAVVMNCDGGTLRGMDTSALIEQIRDSWERQGHTVEFDCIDAKQLEPTLESRSTDDAIDALVVAGGDGTVSAGAGAAWRGGKIFGVLPAGTMNLFARSMGVPLDLSEAIEAIATGEVKPCDIATANGRPYVHLFAIGLHPRAMRLRNRLEYSSRYGKMLASLRAMAKVIRNPRSFWIDIEIEGRVQRKRYSAVTVANNQMGEGHLPYADRLDAGVLGLYCSKRLTVLKSARLIADILRGKWSQNEDVTEKLVNEVTISFPKRMAGSRATIDGEVVRLEPKIHFRTHPGELKILVPSKG